MQARLPSDQKAILEFLKNFKYLNSEGKRSGFSLFNNDELTAKIEQSCQQLINTLEMLMVQPDTSHEDRNALFIMAVSKTVKQVWDDRLQEAPVTRDYQSEIYMGHVVPTNIPASSYKVAHGHGKFEKEIVKGLKAAQPHLGDTAKQQVTTLLDNIDRHIPECINVDHVTGRPLHQPSGAR